MAAIAKMDAPSGGEHEKNEHQSFYFLFSCGEERTAKQLPVSISRSVCFSYCPSLLSFHLFLLLLWWLLSRRGRGGGGGGGVGNVCFDLHHLALAFACLLVCLRKTSSYYRRHCSKYFVDGSCGGGALYNWRRRGEQEKAKVRKNKTTSKKSIHSEGGKV